jgi:hypothetical protein
LKINSLHVHDSLMAGTLLDSASIGAAVEFWTRASTGFAGA